MAKELIVTASFAAAALGFTGACLYGHVDAEGTKQAAAQMGMTDVRITGPAHLACRSWYKTSFTAVTAQGENVDGIACKDLTGISIRLKKPASPFQP